MLVNICLRWQSQAVRVPQPPASLRALCARSPQPSAQRDALGRRAVWRPRRAAQGGPAPHPHLRDGGPERQAAQGPSICPPQPEAETTRCEVPLGSEHAAFPRGHPRFPSFLVWKKAKARDKTLGACLQITAPSTRQHSLPARQLPTGGAHIGSPGPRSPGGPLAGEAFSTAVGGCARYTPAEYLASPSPESPALIRPLGRPSIHPPLLTEHPPVPDTAGWTHGE